MTITRVSNYIKEGYSADEAELILPQIKEAVSKGTAFTIDFANIQFFTTLFFSTALTHLVGDMGNEKYGEIVHVINLSESGKETYEYALDYAVKYYAKTSMEREQERIITSEEAKGV